ncbi:MAG: acetylglutamate kinase [Moraxellaceae bacterium]|nr:acetylglutamate kinase [Pseudobdellovibrionaceae bacterium]
MMKNLDRVVLKLGGSSLQDPSALKEVIESIRGYLRYEYQVIIVHGGGPAINQELTKQGISWKFINGQRQTTLDMITVIEDVLVNKVNKDLVTSLNRAHINAVGVSGSQNEMLFCQKLSDELQFVGEINRVGTLALENILNQSDKTIPVIAPIGVGIDGEKYNINADWAAAKIAVALKAKKLIFLTDQTGILDQSGELIEDASLDFLNDLIETKTVTGGMYTKVLTIQEALSHGVPQVRVLNGKSSVDGLWSDFIGTMTHV